MVVGTERSWDYMAAAHSNGGKHAVSVNGLGLWMLRLVLRALAQKQRAIVGCDDRGHWGGLGGGYGGGDWLVKFGKIGRVG